jgi:hypothetical protein
MAKAIKGGNKGAKKLAKRCRKKIRKMGFTGPIKTIVCDEGQDEVVLVEAAFDVFFGGLILEALEHDDPQTLKGHLELAKFLGFDPFELVFSVGHKDGTTSDCDMLAAAVFGQKYQCVKAVLADLGDVSVAAQCMHPILDDFFAMVIGHFDSGDFHSGKLEMMEKSIRNYFGTRKNVGCLGDDYMSTLSPNLKAMAMAMEVAAEPEDIDDEEGVDVQPHSHAPIATAHSQTSAYSN